MIDITVEIKSNLQNEPYIASVEAVSKPSTILASVQTAGLFDPIKSGDLQIIARSGEKSASAMIGEAWIWEQKSASFKLSKIDKSVSTYEITLTENGRLIDTYTGEF